MVAGFNIRTPTDEDMEIFIMYEVTSQLLSDPQYIIHANNEKSAQLSQGVGPSKHQLMMIDTNFEYGSNITHINLLVMCKMDPTMMIPLEINELYNTSHSSGDDSYHLVYRSDYDMDISNVDTNIRT